MTRPVATQTRRPSRIVVAAVAIAMLVTGCAPAPALTPQSLDPFRGDDGLLHDRDVVGITGEALPEGSAVEGLATTAAALRLLQTSGFEPQLTASEEAALDRAAADATAGDADPDALVGAARVCALAARTSPACSGAHNAAAALLDRPVDELTTGGEPVAVIDAAADLGLREAASDGLLAEALASAEPCVDSAVVRYRARVDAPLDPVLVPDPRERTQKVLSALRDGDIDRALCLSGVVAATVGATPERDEDWLQGPFDEAVAAGFERSADGLYAALDRRRGRIETTRMLSQVSFDLSVALR